MLSHLFPRVVDLPQAARLDRFVVYGLNPWGREIRLPGTRTQADIDALLADGRTLRVERVSWPG